MMIKKLNSREFVFLQNATKSMFSILIDVASLIGIFPMKLGYALRDGTVTREQSLVCRAIKSFRVPSWIGVYNWLMI